MGYDPAPLRGSAKKPRGEFSRNKPGSTTLQFAERQEARPSGRRLQFRHAEAKSILSKTSGFIAEAGFTHSLNPARNCTFGCTYCYVPTMRVQAGLRPEDWRRWGQFTTFKSNAAELLRKQVRAEQIVYCSPLVDPYQPGEEDERLMERILSALIENAPQVFVIQTRGPLIVRDMRLLEKLAQRTTLRVSFSLTTNREKVRRLYEPHCASIADRVSAMKALREAGITVHATLAPLLPCDPRQLAELALEATDQDVIGDPFHVRTVKKRGATTREEAARISARHGFDPWHEPGFQSAVIQTVRQHVEAAGRRFGVGPRGFSWLARP